jgi:hypothetical protein
MPRFDEKRFVFQRDDAVQGTKCGTIASFCPGGDPVKDTLRIPDGWTLESMTGMRDVSVLTAPQIGAATIDFSRRGFRGGTFVLTGKFVGEKLTRSGHVRKLYEGRGWKQSLVDDAIAWLQEVAR